MNAYSNRKRGHCNVTVENNSESIRVEHTWHNINTITRILSDLLRGKHESNKNSTILILDKNARG